MIRWIFSLFLIMASYTAWPDGGGGVGGLDGGSKIWFQRDGIYLEPSRNPTLCLNPQDTYQAKVSVCTLFDNKRDCVGDYKPKTIYQPRVSFQEVCTNRKAREANGQCPDDYRELKPLVQDPVRVIRKLDRDGYVVDEKIFQIPNCQ